TRTFTGTPANADVGTATITVRATDGSGAWVEEQFDVVVANTNDAPTVANPIANQGATEDAPFSFTFAANTFADVDVGDSLAYSASGLPGWLAFDAATRTFTGTPANADVGTATITVRATDGSGAWVEEQFDVVVANTNDAPTGSVLLAGTVTEDQTLTADTATVADADGLGTFSYQWLRDGVAVAGATGPTYALGDADVGASLSVRVSYTDGAGATETLLSASSAPIGNVNDVPVGLPVLVGKTAVGDTLAADTSGVVDADGLGTFSYQWLRDGVEVAGATSPSYLLGVDDVGSELSLRLSYTDTHGTSETLVSVLSGKVTAPQPREPAPVVPVIEVPAVPGTPSTSVTLSDADQGDSSASRQTSSLPSPSTNGSRGADATLLSVEVPEFDVRTPHDVLVAVRRHLNEEVDPLAPGPVEPGQELVVLTAWDEGGARLGLPDGWRLSNTLRRVAEIEVGGGSADRSDGEHNGRDDAGFDLGSTSTLQVVGATVTAGFIWWLTRSGGMLTMMLMGIPAWRHVDLLPVLMRDRDDEEEEEQVEEAAPAGPVHTMYDQLGSHESRLADLFGADTTIMGTTPRELP
ncbi:MAG: putative Ig domain-containing protein, partial [Burkholderiales bacterium]